MNISVKKLTLLSMLIALSVVGRITFTFIPNVQPSTSIIIISSLFLGPLYGFIVAFFTSILSNMVMGMGLWTLGQMVAWGLIGFLSGFIGRYLRKVPFVLLVIYSVFCGFIYGFIISIPMYIMSGKFWAYYLAGLPFDLSHAIGNGMFFVVLYPVLYKLFIDKLAEIN